jgi:hypothetical protein
MDRDQTYFSTFLQPANPYRFGTEQFAMPRMKKTIRHANSKDDLARGYKIGTHGPYALKRLDAHGWSNKKQTGTAFNALRNSIIRKDTSKIRKKWFFATYSDDSSVSFVQFDLDRHYSSDMLPDERAEMDHAFNQQVQSIKEMAEEVGCDVVFTTSPGDILGGSWSKETKKWEGGEHVQGLYAWIKLENPVKVSKLREYVQAIKEYYGIECESSVDAKNRLVRLPGQRYVEMADPETATILHEEEKPAHGLARFADAWFEAKPANLKKLFSPAWSWKNQEIKKSVKTVKSKPVLAKTVVPVRNVTVVGASSSQSLDEPNTFLAATSRKICSRITIKYQGQRCYFDKAVQEAKQELCSIRPSTSKTCSSLSLLESTVRRWMDWYFTKFDSGKCFASSRDIQDAERFRSSLLLEESFIFRFIEKHVHLHFREKKILSAIFAKMKIWRGRIHCHVLYELAGGRTAWFKIQNKLKGFFVVLDEWELKKCRQWAWSKTVINGVASMNEAANDVAEMLVSPSPKKNEKQVVVENPLQTMNNSTLEHTSMLIASISSPIHADSYEFT